MDPNTQRLFEAAAGGAAGFLGVEDVFSTDVYTGNNLIRSITNGIDLSGEGGLLWGKRREDAGYWHVLTDTERGINKVLKTQAADADTTRTDMFSSFNSDGFDLSTGNTLNANGKKNVVWTFRKAEKFFDVVTWTGNSVSGRSIAHSLGSTPGCIIVKSTTAISDWMVWHRTGISSGVGCLNLTDSFTSRPTVTNWFTSPPTDTEFFLSADGFVNNNGDTYVAYLFAHDAGGFGDDGTESVIKCGSFTSDGSGNTGTINLGWEPQFIILKNADNANNWITLDTLREWDLSNNKALLPNLSNAETDLGASYLAPTATGFSGTGNLWGANKTIVYIAIRRGPMKTPTDATTVFNAITRTGTGTNNLVVNTTVLPDLLFPFYRTSATRDTYDRLRGFGQTLVTSSAGAEINNYPTYGPTAFNNTSYIQGNSDGAVYNASGTNFVDWIFSRAPGFFDMVAYTGTGSATTVSHNLGVAPELIIVKQRNASEIWPVYDAFNGNTYNLQLQRDFQAVNTNNFWNNTSPTSTVFSVSGVAQVNGSGNTYIAYLFASCPGVSKVGSYTGTGIGTTLDVNCGFSAGARFVLIKRTDSTGDWYVWDSARGITAGNDPYLLLNSTAAEVTGTNYIDTLSSGFQITSSAPAAINASGGSFIFLAVA